ncbi:MAG: DUF4124 domain-containing protein [Pelovirga sp.]
MRTALFAMILCLLVPVSGFATLYSCRDSTGRLHVTDNLQSLPDECRSSARELDPNDPDNVQFVPPLPPVEVENSRFEQEVLEQQRRLEERRATEQRMIDEAEELLATYLQAQQERRNAQRSWSYSSRETIQQATEEIARVRADKERLLGELREQRLPTETVEKIRRALAQIDAP